MRKILKSLFVIGVVAVVAFGATRAFFSDTEESKNNRFQAGAIDLKVDSDGHYNGLECYRDIWQDCVYVGSGTELLGNRGFENPEVTHSEDWDVFPNGTLGLVWTVEWKDPVNPGGRPDPALQELQENGIGWSPHEGDQWTELDSDWNGHVGNLNNEPALVRIYQNIPTESAKHYRLTYWYSARPGRPAADNQMSVWINGVQQAFHNAGAGGVNTSWVQGTVEFVASTDSTRVEFVGEGANNSYGMFLDDVSFVELVKDCVPSQEYTEPCYSRWSLMDLGPENKFFSFSDLKPGDWGENTVSLHVYNNDAYACMYTRNYSDVEVDPASEPETEVDTTTVQGDPGEVSQHLKFFVWRDDGDNLWEEGEEVVTREVSGDVFLNNWVYGLALPTNPMEQSHTKFLGVAWCFGEMTVVPGQHVVCDGSQASYNEAQTDAVSSDIGFYVEQARHNEGFTCDRIPAFTPTPTLEE